MAITSLSLCVLIKLAGISLLLKFTENNYFIFNEYTQLNRIHFTIDL